MICHCKPQISAQRCAMIVWFGVTLQTAGGPMHVVVAPGCSSGAAMSILLIIINNNDLRGSGEDCGWFGAGSRLGRGQVMNDKERKRHMPQSYPSFPSLNHFWVFLDLKSEKRYHRSKETHWRPGDLQWGEKKFYLPLLVHLVTLSKVLCSLSAALSAISWWGI